MKNKIKLSVQITIVVVILFLLATLLTGCAILLRGLGQKDAFTYMIVLGTTVEDDKPSAMLQDRIDAAAKYMESNPHVIAIVTGDRKSVV